MQAPPLAGQNSLTGFAVEQGDKGNWIATFDYFFTGAPLDATLRVRLLASGSGDALPGDPFTFVPIKRGANRASVEIQRPQGRFDAFATTHVMAEMRSADQVLASQLIAKTIPWPDHSTWSLRREMANKPNEEFLAKAVSLVDNGDVGSLTMARQILERLIQQDPKFEPAFVELARVAMKSNWGPEGLSQAETLLQSALQINPHSVNAKILLGYVYAHQRKFPAAEALFAEVSQGETKNLWLWANWGEVLAMQGKSDLAAAKYREAFSRPRTHDTYDRARVESYRRYAELQERRKEFGPGHCLNAEYANFLLQQGPDVNAAIGVARQTIDLGCSESRARDVLGVAYYVAWSTSAAPEREVFLNQARVFLPAGPKVMYLLAMSDRTLSAARQLVKSGDSVDQRDNAQVTALAYALQDRNHAAARRLLKLGARPDTTVGGDEVPVAVIPVLFRDYEGIRLMRQSGIDYSRVRYRGSTALDFAKKLGDRQLLEALGLSAQAA